MKRVKLGNKRVSDQRKNEKPTEMQVDRYLVDPPDLDSLTAHRFLGPHSQYSLTRFVTRG